MFKVETLHFFSKSNFSKTEGDGDKRVADSCSGQKILQESPSGYYGTEKKFHFVGLCNWEVLKISYVFFVCFVRRKLIRSRCGWKCFVVRSTCMRTCFRHGALTDREARCCFQSLPGRKESIISNTWYTRLKRLWPIEIRLHSSLLGMAFLYR